MTGFNTPGKNSLDTYIMKEVTVNTPMGPLQRIFFNAAGSQAVVGQLFEGQSAKTEVVSLQDIKFPTTGAQKQ